MLAAPRRDAAGDKPDWFGESVAVGDKVDAQNRNGVWWKGEVVEVTRHDVVVHFDGWDKLHDTFVPKRSDMIAPYDTETEGVDTRGTITADAEFEVSEESLRPYVEKIDSIISREASPAESVSQSSRAPRVPVASLLAAVLATRSSLLSLRHRLVA